MPRARASIPKSIDSADDVPGQLDLFPPIAGDKWELFMPVDYPAAADRRLVMRLNEAGRRLRRGVIASEAKLRRLAPMVEEILTLFDGG